jgi:hypothetical protein
MLDAPDSILLSAVAASFFLYFILQATFSVVLDKGASLLNVQYKYILRMLPAGTVFLARTTEMVCCASAALETVQRDGVGDGPCLRCR